MKVRPSLYNKYEEKEVALEECVEYVAKQEDGYFLDFSDPKDMYNEFLACSEIYVSPEDYDELEDNEEKVTAALIKLRETMNNSNYQHYIEDGAQFMVDCWHGDFEDYSNYPVFGEARLKAFADTIRFLYNKYCNEEIE